MATTIKALFRGVVTTTLTTTLYTVPAATLTQVTDIEIANPAATAVTATISFDGVVFVPTVSIPANGQYSWNGKMPLGATKLIQGGSSVITTTFHIGGVEIA